MKRTYYVRDLIILSFIFIAALSFGIFDYCKKHETKEVKGNISALPVKINYERL